MSFSDVNQTSHESKDLKGSNRRYFVTSCAANEISSGAQGTISPELCQEFHSARKRSANFRNFINCTTSYNVKSAFLGVLKPDCCVFFVCFFIEFHEGQQKCAGPVRNIRIQAGVKQG